MQDRPEFMVTLGLLPPYTVEDVRMAYREKAKVLHPDRGGSVAEFKKLKEAYERATEYAQFRSSRRHWLAAQVDRYVEQEAVVAEVRRRGGDIEVEQIEWIRHSIGDDFALVTERLRGIRLRNLVDADVFLRYLAAQKQAHGYLTWLDLAGCAISDDGLFPLRSLELLKRLDLAGTPITKRGLAVLQALPNLEWLNLAGTSISWWTRWRFQQSNPRLRVVTAR
jgi:hypothetical protein